MIKKGDGDRSKGFKKTGQIKVSQNPLEGLKKLANADEKEYGVDDLVKDSDKEVEDGDSNGDE
jgi:hypothetical protein